MKRLYNWPPQPSLREGFNIQKGILSMLKKGRYAKSVEALRAMASTRVLQAIYGISKIECHAEPIEAQREMASTHVLRQAQDDSTRSLLRPQILGIKAFSTLLVFLLPIILFSCSVGAPTADDDADANVKSITPVTVITVADSSLTDYTDLNAISSFQQKSVIKANANGYIQKANVQPGHYVNKGQVLFTIKTKESQTIGNSINILDTTFKFSGVNTIKASTSGYVTQINHQTGDYVQDGEQLAVISDRSSFVFLMQLPYELQGAVKLNQDVQLLLPDGSKLTGKATSFMPSVDTLSQTQGIVVKVNTGKQLPENLVVKARIIKSQKSNIVSLPKSAILSNETQTGFWVMKLINATTAVKTPVQKGIESGDRVEILSPKFSAQDKIVVSGNYGLPDTAKVKIVQ